MIWHQPGIRSVMPGATPTGQGGRGRQHQAPETRAEAPRGDLTSPEGAEGAGAGPGTGDRERGHRGSVRAHVLHAAARCSMAVPQCADGSAVLSGSLPLRVPYPGTPGPGRPL